MGIHQSICHMLIDRYLVNDKTVGGCWEDGDQCGKKSPLRLELFFSREVFEDRKRFSVSGTRLFQFLVFFYIFLRIGKMTILSFPLVMKTLVFLFCWWGLEIDFRGIFWINQWTYFCHGKKLRKEKTILKSKLRVCCSPWERELLEGRKGGSRIWAIYGLRFLNFSTFVTTCDFFLLVRKIMIFKAVKFFSGLRSYTAKIKCLIKWFQMLKTPFIFIKISIATKQ